LAAERGALWIKLAATETRVSECLLQAGRDCNQIMGLKRVAEQADVLRRALDAANQKLEKNRA
jgi:hypothetical protein